MHTSRIATSTLSLLTMITLLTMTSCADDASPNDVARDDLEGTWKSACFQATQTTLSYRDLQLSGTFTEFSDQACATPRHVATWTAQATGGDEVSPGVRKLNLAFSSFKSRPLTTAEAAFVNQNAYCGITDWASDVERDILGLSCYGLSIPMGGKSLDIYQRDASSLRFGKDSKIAAMPAEADRPAEIDPNRVFVRQ
jgi:hypothetical protein